MKRTALIALVALLALAAWWLSRSGRSAPASAELDRNPAAGSALTQSPASVPAPEHAGEQSTRSRVESGEVLAAPSEPAPAPSAREAARVNGRVLDLTGNPLEGIALVVADRAREVATSAVGGRFEFAVPATIDGFLGDWRSELLLAPGQRWTSTCNTPFSAEHCTGLVVVAAPAIEIGGLVVDETGAGVQGAQVSLTISSQSLREFPGVLDRSSSRELKTESAADGAFRMASVPAIAGCVLLAGVEGKLRGSLPLPQSTALDLKLVVKPIGGDEQVRLAGLVLSAEGQPVEGARVSVDDTSTKTGSDGRFELDVHVANTAATLLCAAKQGFQAAVVDVADHLAFKDVSPLVVRLGPATLEIRGTIFGSDGKPAKGWIVQLQGGTELSKFRAPPIIAEKYTAGEMRFRSGQATDSDGRFTLAGLFPKNYGIRAYDNKSLLVLTAQDVPAGSQDVVLRVPDDATWAEVSGAVVDRRGNPVAGAEVTLELVISSTGGGQSWTSSKAVKTTAEGEFHLKNVPRREVRLAVHGDELMEQRWELGELEMEKPLRLVVDMRCHFRVICEKHDPSPDLLEVLDDQGANLQLFTFQNGGWSSSSQQSIESGATHSLGVSERARTLVLKSRRGVEDVARLPLNLIPGQVVDVRY